MIKATQKDIPSKAVKPAKVSDDFIEWYAQHTCTDIGRYVQSRDNLARTEAQVRARVHSYIREIRQYKEERERIENELKAFDMSAYTKKGEEMVEQLKKLSFIDSVRIRGDRLLIRTHLLFTDIRLQDGARTNKRACIGAFEIRFDMTRPQSLRIKNLVFHNGLLGHWSIKNEIPCLGDWDRTFNDAWSRHDLYQICTILLSYLKSTADGGAWVRSHNWRDSRVKMVTRTALRVGSYCIITEDYYDDVFIPKGSLAKVVSRWDEDTVIVEFKKRITSEDGETVEGHDADGQGEMGHCWGLNRSYFMSITKAQYEADVTWDMLSNGNIEKLDALPDGSTLLDAKKILKK